ncbi:MAG: hypothetical protein JW967_04280 [Dehalococcoidales bacterium]|nr:hypothetical protein [Dehalococcoidales bacterium]
MLELIEKSQAVLAPDFDRVDTDGKGIKLSNYRKKSSVVLVFNRGFK